MKPLLILTATAAALACSLNAQDKPKETPKVPVISAELQKQYFKLQSQHAQALQVTKTIEDSIRSTINDMSKVCGDKYQLSTSSDGDIICAEKPKEQKK